MICGHLCHPYMVNDGLSGVVAGIEAMRRIMQWPDPYYTYRLIILPETIGSAAFLSHNLELIPKIKGGVFLEMLGTEYAHSVQRSVFVESEMDQLVEQIVNENDPDAWIADFPNVVLNDERMFNAPGIRVPMLSLSRVAIKGRPEFPFRQYHTNMDTPEHINFERLSESADLIVKIFQALENNFVPEAKFRGELFCSRYSRIDYEAMFEILSAVIYRIDGRRTVLDICREAGLQFERTREILEILEDEGLIAWKIKA